ncbi:D-alanyl-D-alanine carboxypeptidase family protein, partial [Quadrisphaera sp. RL12-1S]|uniref:M15 family metallopeptidase n=1 Tax=Quadrisphaera sp. RL12-1S TaxID=2763011 RepID=UPI001646913E
QPRAAEPARPGSRRALREQAAASAAPLAATAPEPRLPFAAEAAWAPAAPELPTRSDTEVLAQLEALLAEPFVPLSTEPAGPAVPAAPAALDLRTDPLLPDVGWARHRPETAAPAVPAPAPARWSQQPDVLEVPEAPAAPAADPRSAPWTPAIGITPVVLAPAPVAAAVADALLAADAEPATEAFAPRRGRGAHRLPRRVRVALPHAAVVGALGVATLVAPLVGTHLRAEADTATGTTVDAGASTARAAAAASLAEAADVVAGRASEALSLSRASERDAAVQAASDRASAAKAAADAAALQQQQEAQRLQAAKDAADQAAADHRAAIQGLVGQCSGVRPDTDGSRNGRLDDDQMCDLWSPGHQLRSDAAVAFAELNLAYHDHFGKDIVITDSYRSYAAQVAVRRKKPGLAAVPGTSEHGWGLAVDLGDGVQNSDEHYDWLIENAPKYGWDHPSWARRGGGGPYEPWHWEFVAGE